MELGTVHLEIGVAILCGGVVLAMGFVLGVMFTKPNDLLDGNMARCGCKCEGKIDALTVDVDSLWTDVDMIGEHLVPGWRDEEHEDMDPCR